MRQLSSAELTTKWSMMRVRRDDDPVREVLSKMFRTFPQSVATHDIRFISALYLLKRTEESFPSTPCHEPSEQ
jgi:hypothetical protein